MSRLPLFGLLIVAALWGLTFPLVEYCVQIQNPVLFVSLRFTLASAFVLPFLLKGLNKETIIVGAVMGAMNCGAFLTQTIGLQYVNASRAAFLTGIYVLLIPFIAPLFKMRAPTLIDFICACLCFSGIYILSGCDVSRFTFGDIWILLSVVFIAFSIVYVTYQGRRGVDPYMLSYSQIVMTGLFSWVGCGLFGNFDFSALQDMGYLSALFVCSFLATIVAIVLQSKFQKSVSAQQAALVFSLEPVFAALFDYLIMGSQPTKYLVYGGGIILISVMLAEILRPEEEQVPVKSGDQTSL